MHVCMWIDLHREIFFNTSIFCVHLSEPEFESDVVTCICFGPLQNIKFLTSTDYVIVVVYSTRAMYMYG